MTTDSQENLPQVNASEEVLQTSVQSSERLSISPVAYAFLALLVVFVLYQIVGGTATLLIFGSKVRPETVQWLRLATMVGQMLLILIPTILLARFQSANVRETLRLRGTGLLEVLLAIVGVLSLQQLLQVYMILQDQIPIPTVVQPFVESIRKAIEETYKELASSHSIPELFYVLIVVALVPAFCEELLFRGLVQKNFERGLKGWWAIIFPGIIFGAYHFNPFSFLPLVVLGVYLGFLVYRSNSILTSIVAHFANNLFAVVSIFFNSDEGIFFHDETAVPSASMIFQIVVGFGVIFSVSMYAFVKLTRRMGDVQVG
jgi:membrane protease YdiL (CAAX protease family)